MDPKLPGYSLSAAPAASAASQMGRRPQIWDHVIDPENDERIQVIDGRKVRDMAKLPHAGKQGHLARILGSVAAPGYICATELTTRADTEYVAAPLDPVPPDPFTTPEFPEGTQDFSADACLVLDQYDARTGARALEEMAFEIADTQGLLSLKRKADRLSRRGVRRVFGMLVKDLKHQRVGEWHPERNDFVWLNPEDVIQDRCLRQPLPVRAILEAAAADDAVAQALIDKGNPVIEEFGKDRKAEGKTEGKAEGLREAIRDLCEVFGIEVGSQRQAHLESLDLPGLERLKGQLKQSRTWPS